MAGHLGRRSHDQRQLRATDRQRAGIHQDVGRGRAIDDGRAGADELGECDARQNLSVLLC